MPDDYYVSQYSGEEIDERLTAAHNAVRYDAAQTLTDAQKTQVRGNIAAAPDGFGLGANGYPNPYTVVTGATIDALNESGLFWYRDENTPIYPDGGNSGVSGSLLNIVGNRENTLASRQIFYPYLPYGGVALGFSCMRMQTSDGEWQPWEWVNPPMMLGVEYRTTERYLGKPVYVKKVDFGNAPAGSIKEVSCATNVANVVDFNLTVWNGAYGQENIIINDDGTLVARPYSKLSEGTLSIALAVFEDISTRTVDLVVKYTKTTD